MTNIITKNEDPNSGSFAEAKLRDRESSKNIRPKQLNLFGDEERSPVSEISRGARAQFYSDPRVKEISSQLVNKDCCLKCGGVSQ